MRPLGASRGLLRSRGVSWGLVRHHGVSQDFTVSHVLLLIEKPRLEFAYDTDPKQSAATRVKYLTLFAEKRIPILAYHFPWPGYGYLSKQGDGFRYHAAPMEIVTIPPKKA